MQTGIEPRSLSGVGLFGVFLAVAGSILDFYSGYQILAQSTTNDMGVVVMQYTSSGLAWGVGIIILGAALVITAPAVVSSFGMRRMRTFGTLMVAYGIIMLFVGISMYRGVTPMMQGITFSGLGMLVVGPLMVFNGAIMWRSRTFHAASQPKSGQALRNASFVIVGIAIVIAASFVADPSLIQGPTPTLGANTTSTRTSASGSAHVAASAANCSSGSTEQCRMMLTNSGTGGTAITGAGTLTYSGAGGMGIDSVGTQSGCTALTGSLGPGQSEQVSCAFTVAELPVSGTQMTGTVALSNGDSVSFTGAAS
ncbi:MAG TPA: hypothetical protein VGR53_03090 [Nitrososphaerales archaeon]|nr:hypothetical protein [Nitrososphaerales archaeon]